jgi:hypothetical protein
VEDLEGDQPLVLDVAGQVDRGHATAAKLPLERVTVLERVAKRRYVSQVLDPLKGSRNLHRIGVEHQPNGSALNCKRW